MLVTKEKGSGNLTKQNKQFYTTGSSHIGMKQDMNHLYRLPNTSQRTTQQLMVGSTTQLQNSMAQVTSKGIFVWNPFEEHSKHTERLMLYRSPSIISPLSINLVESSSNDPKIEIYFIEEVGDKQLLKDDDMKAIEDSGKKRYLRKIVICGMLGSVLQNIQVMQKRLSIFQ
jgi:hypothetical protein